MYGFALERQENRDAGQAGVRQASGLRIVNSATDGSFDALVRGMILSPHTGKEVDPTPMKSDCHSCTPSEVAEA